MNLGAAKLHSGTGPVLAVAVALTCVALTGCGAVGSSAHSVVRAAPVADSSEASTAPSLVPTASPTATGVAPTQGVVAVVPPSMYLPASITTHPHAVLSPPPDGASAVSTQVAAAALKPVAGDLSAFTPYLALYTNSDYGTTDATGTFTPSYTNVLVWAFVAKGAYSGDSGGLVGENGEPATPSLSPGATCTAVWLADAATGAYMMGFSDCD